jgi:hypothetical protein
MDSAPKLTLTFKDQHSFGTFCVALKSDHVPFSLAGFHTVVLAQPQLEKLPAHSHELLEKAKAGSLVDISPVTTGGQRPPFATPAQAKALLRKFAQEL